MTQLEPSPADVECQLARVRLIRCAKLAGKRRVHLELALVDSLVPPSRQPVAFEPPRYRLVSDHVDAPCGVALVELHAEAVVDVAVRPNCRVDRTLGQSAQAHARGLGE